MRVSRLHTPCRVRSPGRAAALETSEPHLSLRTTLLRVTSLLNNPTPPHQPSWCAGSGKRAKARSWSTEAESSRSTFYDQDGRGALRHESLRLAAGERGVKSKAQAQAQSQAQAQEEALSSYARPAAARTARPRPGPRLLTEGWR